MLGGVIEGNTATGDTGGGGVYCMEARNFSMYDGRIRSNTAKMVQVYY